MKEIERLMRRVETEHKASKTKMENILSLSADPKLFYQSMSEFYSNYLLEHMHNEEDLLEKIRPELLAEHKKAHGIIDQYFRQVIEEIHEHSIEEMKERVRPILGMIKDHQANEDRECFTRAEGTN